MAKRKVIRTATEPKAEPIPMSATIGIVDGTVLQTTGRYIVIFKKDTADAKSVKNTLNKTAGLRNLVSSSDFKESGIPSENLELSDGVHFENLGIALVSEEPMQSLAASISDADSPILAIEPEYIAYLSEPTSQVLPLEYLRGYRDAVNQLYDQLAGHSATENLQGQIAQVFEDTAQFTWGLQATKVTTSRFTGKGIKVAILDTGFDLQHPDFKGRPIISETFSGFPVQDVNGHGTHCVGTACGPLRPATGVRRYGVAPNAQIFVGKVFNNDPRPSAPTGNVLAGIEWALSNGCAIASLSLGVPINQKAEQYEVTIARALNAGLLVVAAAGNNASRPQNPGFVEPPANADAALAIAALDNTLNIASFSARSSQVTGVGGSVNIAGPGVNVFSSVPVDNGRHDFFNGTSMATPHIAGIAALIAEATGASGQALWNKLVQTALPLNLPSMDVGSGLAQAPQ
jgi:subtilisin